MKQQGTETRINLHLMCATFGWKPGQYASKSHQMTDMVYSLWWLMNTGIQPKIIDF